MIPKPSKEFPADEPKTCRQRATKVKRLYLLSERYLPWEDSFSVRKLYARTERKERSKTGNVNRAFVLPPSILGTFILIVTTPDFLFFN